MAMNLCHLNNSLLTNTTQPLFFLFQHKHKPMTMLLSSFHLHHRPLSLSSIVSSSFNRNPNPNPSRRTPSSTPARDIVVTFGKHRGQMLGTIPSSYLTWVSKNLGIGDTLHWAELADEVLADPVYRDRLEWECVHRILSGDDATTLRLSSDAGVSELFEMAHKFGWDMEDKAGWAQVDFALLGTSKGGRIPRKKTNGNEPADTDRCDFNGQEMRERRKKKGFGEGLGLVSRKREERIERRRRMMTLLEDDDDDEDMERNQNPNSIPMLGSEDDENLGHRNPFPGRESLFEKMRQRRRDRSG